MMESRAYQRNKVELCSWTQSISLLFWKLGHLAASNFWYFSYSSQFLKNTNHRSLNTSTCFSYTILSAIYPLRYLLGLAYEALESTSSPGFESPLNYGWAPSTISGSFSLRKRRKQNNSWVVVLSVHVSARVPSSPCFSGASSSSQLWGKARGL